MMPPTPPAAVTVITVPVVRPAWFLCDAVDAPIAALVGRPDRKGRISIEIVPRGTGRPVETEYEVGAGDAGMNQIHYLLSHDGQPAGEIHYVQPSVLADPGAAWTPTFGSVRIGTRTLTCRWVPNTLFMGIDARRSFLVTQEGKVIVYRSFDVANRGAVVRPTGFGATNRATLTIAGGVREPVDGGRRFRFVHRGYRYTITAPDDAPATVTVDRGGRTIQTERLLAHVLGAR